MLVFSNHSFLYFSYILSKKGISASQNANSSGTDENSVRLDFSVPTAEIANNLILKKSEFAVLGEPYATVAAKNSSQIRRVENLSKIYSELDGDFLTSPAILLVANAKFVSKNKNLVNQFIEVYRQATDWTKKNPEKAALLAEKHNLGVKSQIARISIPNAALTFRNALSGKAEIEKILSLFLDSKPETVGGSLPADEFYFR